MKLKLTNRENQIGKFLARGMPRKQISAKLEISLWTLDAHMRAIRYKVGCSSMQELIAFFSANTH